MKFREFLLTEQRAYLGQKVGDILTAAHELRNDSKHMGTRDLVRFSEKIVNQIRRILHSQWPREEKKFLLQLQKIAVALMKSIEEKEDLPQMVSSITGELEKLSQKLGVPIHKLVGGDKAEPEEEMKGTSDPLKKKSDSSPGTMNQPAGPAPPPPGGPPGDAQPPLGGGSGPLDAF